MSLVDTAAAGSWKPLKLSPFVNNTLDSMGFATMTPVQASVIPLFLLQHKDVVVQAVTGSGKTLAFVIPMLEKLARRETPLKQDQVGGIIICPTRELAIQTHKVIDTFIQVQCAQMDEQGSTSTQQRLRAPLLLVGGNSTLKQDVEAFRKTGCDIIVGTPGRMEEFLLGSSSLASKTKKGKSAALPSTQVRSVCNVKELEMLVLDEADRVLELGYRESINRILAILPKQRRTGCFSATMSEGLGELCRVGLRNPVRIVVKVERKANQGQAPAQTLQERNTPASLSNTFALCGPATKLARLMQLLKHESTFRDEPTKIIVYFATCACVDYFHKLLSPLRELSDFSFYPLHGQQTPAKRTSTYHSFVAASTFPAAPHQVLLCTDVAARGLDLPSVDVVIQFDPPQDPKQFNHRAGRTARAGRSGKAIVLLCRGREEEYVDYLKRRGVPLKQHDLLEEPSSKDVQLLHTNAIKIVLSDRDLHEKGARAFVSFVRSYSKHEASFIFSVKGYDLVGLARSFHLLRLPAMPELRGLEGVDEAWKDAPIDWDTYAYKNKDKEAARQKVLQEQQERIEQGLPAADLKRKKGPSKPTKAWSHKLQARERKDVRREKKARKKAYLKAQVEELPKPAEPAEEAFSYDSDDDSGQIDRGKPAAKRVKKGQLEMADFDFSA